MDIFQKFNGLSKGASFPPELVKRVSAGVLIVGCVLLVGWSIFFRLSLITEAQSKMHTPFSLDRQVASLEQMWSEEEAATVKHEWATAKSQSFGDYDHLTSWVTQMAAQAGILGLAVRYQIDDTSTPVPGIQAVHRLGMKMTIQAENPAEGYHHIMQFVRMLSEEEVNLNFDLMELTGLGNGVQKMEIQLHTFLQQAT